LNTKLVFALALISLMFVGCSGSSGDSGKAELAPSVETKKADEVPSKKSKGADSDDAPRNRS
jgi:PBP1b-binding outer membrane lipoprotein LpoB